MLVGLQRHGETDGVQGFNGRTDLPLTPAGWSQMWRAVEARDWDRVISSPLTRCAEFSRALSRQRSLPVTLDDRLQEMDFGAWEGRTAVELMQTDAEALTRFWEDPTRHPPTNGESLTVFRARVLAAWEAIIASETDDSWLCVAHGGVIRVILCHVLGHPVERLMELDVARGSLWTVSVDHRADEFYTSVDQERS